MKISFIPLPFVVFGSLLLAVSTSGCAFFGGGPNEVKMNTQPAFTECLKVCYDSNTRARNSYTACLDGCGRAAADYPLAGDFFNDFDRCEDEIVEIRAEGMSGSSRNLCNDLARDYARLKGCEEGVANFYRVIAAHSACEPVNANAGDILAAPGQGSPGSQSNPDAWSDTGQVRTQDLSE